MALRIIMNVPTLAHSAPLFNDCEIITIQNRVKFRTVTLVYESLNGLTTSTWLICSRKLLMSLLETQDPASPIGSMSQGGICVLVGHHYDTMVLYYIIH